jgi:UPF0716 protein FxsA
MAPLARNQPKAGHANLRPRFIPLLLVLFFLIEVGAFVAVASLVGVLAAIGLAFLTSVLGGILLRIQGLSVIMRMQRLVQSGGTPGRELIDALMIALAGFLLILPGFVTDVFGLLLFTPPVRGLVWSFLKSRISVITTPFSRKPRDEGVIDLDEGEFRRDDKSPWRRLDDR